MNLQKLADQYRLRIRLDGCGDRIIPGHNGHLYTDGGNLFLMLTDDGRKKPFRSAHFKQSAVRRLKDRAIVTVDCDYEAILRITDLSEETIRLVLLLCGIKRRRIPSPKALAHLARIWASRQREISRDPLQEGPEMPQKSGDGQKDGD